MGALSVALALIAIYRPPKQRGFSAGSIIRPFVYPAEDFSQTLTSPGDHSNTTQNLYKSHPSAFANLAVYDLQEDACLVA